MFEQKRFTGRHLLTFESQKLNYFGKKKGPGVLTLQCNSYLSHVWSFFKISSHFLSIPFLLVPPFKNVFQHTFISVNNRGRAPSKYVNKLAIGFNFFIPDKKKSHKILCSYIFIIHNDLTYITGDYTKLCLNIICNRSFFYFEMMSALFRSEFYTRMKRYWGENISIYRMRKLLFTILR